MLFPWNLLACPILLSFYFLRYSAAMFLGNLSLTMLADVFLPRPNLTLPVSPNSFSATFLVHKLKDMDITAFFSLQFAFSFKTNTVLNEYFFTEVIKRVQRNISFNFVVNASSSARAKLLIFLPCIKSCLWYSEWLIWTSNSETLI